MRIIFYIVTLCKDNAKMDSDQFIRPYRMLSILLLAQRYVKETNSTIINDILSQISFPE